MANIYYNNLPFEDNFLSGSAHNETLGRFFTIWSQIESVYCFIGKTLSSAEPAYITTFMDLGKTRELLDIITGFAKTIGDEGQRDACLALMERVKAISTKRNRLTHSGWGYYNSELARFSEGLSDNDLNEIMLETQKGQSIRKKRIHTVSDINAIIAEGVILRDELTAMLHALPDKRVEQMLAIADLQRENLTLHQELRRAQSRPPEASEA